jgi:hypothetical protein
VPGYVSPADPSVLNSKILLDKAAMLPTVRSSLEIPISLDRLQMELPIPLHLRSIISAAAKPNSIGSIVIPPAIPLLWEKPFIAHPFKIVMTELPKRPTLGACLWP